MEPQVIMTCFAGRRRYLEILVKYVDKLIAKGLVDEFHMWDYTRDPEDAVWIRDNCQRFKIFEVQDKSVWKEYYMHYSKIKYPNPDTVLIKCDDDIMFIDIDQFQSYIDKRRANPNNLLAFASIVNNRVPGLIQHKFGQWPEMKVDQVDNLHHSGEICDKLHNYFIKNHHDFLKISKNLTEIKCTLQRDPQALVNINFFAILAKDLLLFENCWENDEYNLSQVMPICINRSNYVDPGFVVCHMSFTGQRELGFDETEALKGYSELSVTTLDNIVNH
jgi:hypothetical protein